MTRAEIKAIFPEATDEQLDKVLAVNGKEVEANKKLQTQLEDAKNNYKKLSDDMDELKKANASGEDFKKKFEELQNEIKTKEAKAAEEAKAKETAEALDARFNALENVKNMRHPAIKADYRRKFEEALSDKNYAGKSDVEILHELTKNDPEAYKSVEKLHLEGNKGVNGQALDDAKIRSIMGLPPKKD